LEGAINADEVFVTIIPESDKSVVVAGAKSVDEVMAIENFFTHKETYFLQCNACGHYVLLISGGDAQRYAKSFGFGALSLLKASAHLSQLFTCFPHGAYAGGF
jgi:hypothetical protein